MFNASLTRRTGVSTLLLVLLLLVSPRLTAQAADLPVYISLSVGAEEFQPGITLGRTLKLSIFIVNASDHLVRANSFDCKQSLGTAYRVESVSRLPGTIAPQTTFPSEQYYHAVSPGPAQVTCVLTATDTVTGESFTRTNTFSLPRVLGERRLVVEGYADTQRFTLSQSAHITIVYTNRSSALITNISARCGQLGRGVMIDTQRQNYTALRPNESGFIIFRLKALFAGGSGLYLCTVQATDSRTNEVFTVPLPPISVMVAA